MKKYKYRLSEEAYSFLFLFTVLTLPLISTFVSFVIENIKLNSLSHEDEELFKKLNYFVNLQYWATIGMCLMLMLTCSIYWWILGVMPFIKIKYCKKFIRDNKEINFTSFETGVLLDNLSKQININYTRLIKLFMAFIFLVSSLLILTVNIIAANYLSFSTTFLNIFTPSLVGPILSYMVIDILKTKNPESESLIKWNFEGIKFKDDMKFFEEIKSEVNLNQAQKIRILDMLKAKNDRYQNSIEYYKSSYDLFIFSESELFHYVLFICHFYENLKVAERNYETFNGTKKSNKYMLRYFRLRLIWRNLILENNSSKTFYIYSRLK